MTTPSDKVDAARSRRAMRRAAADALPMRAREAAMLARKPRAEMTFIASMFYFVSAISAIFFSRGYCLLRGRADGAAGERADRRRGRRVARRRAAQSSIRLASDIDI